MRSSDFFDQIDEELKKGYGFIPLVGSGVSYQSGIMLGTEIIQYLSYTYFLKFLKKKPTTDDLGIEWPRPPKTAEFKKVLKEIIKEYNTFIPKDSALQMSENGEIKFRNDKQPSSHPIFFGEIMSVYLSLPRLPAVLKGDPGSDTARYDDALMALAKMIGKQQSTDVEAYHLSYPITDQALIRKKGIAALYYWVEALSFFSRLKYDDVRQRYTMHEVEDPGIIDRFNTMMVGNRIPNHCHYLLARLSEPFKSKIFLTTNFDSLLERSIAECGIPIRSLALEKKSQIPSIDHLIDSALVLKLHGELHNTRADRTIHEAPTLQDRNRFKDILCPTSSRSASPESHLLLVGTSLSDKRISELITFTLRETKDLKVFIITNSLEGRERYLNILGQEFFDEGRVHFSPPQKAEFVLYELYQRTTLSLPPGGMHFQYDQYTPPIGPALTENIQSGPGVDEAIDKIKNFLSEGAGVIKDLEKEDLATRGIRISDNVISIVGHCGVTGLASKLFFELQNKHFKCSWFELEDYCNEKELLSDILRSILYELGKIGLETIRTNILDAYQVQKPGIESFRELRSLIARYLDPLNITNSEWVFFIYGRNGAGECAGLGGHRWTSFENLQLLLSALSRTGFRIVYLPYTNQRDIQFKKNLRALAGETPAGNGKVIDDNYEDNLHDSPAPFTDEENVNPFMQESEAFRACVSLREEIDKRKQSNDTAFLQFIYKSALFRQSRHLNALISEAVISCPEKFNAGACDNDIFRWGIVKEWMESLKKIGIFRQKPGGYSWLFAEAREGIIHLLGGDENVAGKEIRSKAHLQIGDWYFRAFIATHHTTPLKEAVHHWVSAIDHAGSAKPSIRNEKDSPLEAKLSVARLRVSLIIRALTSIGKIYRVSRQYLPCWINESASQNFFNIKEYLSHKKINSVPEVEDYLKKVTELEQDVLIEHFSGAIRLLDSAKIQTIQEARAYEMMLTDIAGDPPSIFARDSAERPSEEPGKIDLTLDQFSALRKIGFMKCNDLHILGRSVADLLVTLVRDTDHKYVFEETLKTLVYNPELYSKNRLDIESFRHKLRNLIVQQIFKHPSDILKWIRAMTNAASVFACKGNLISRADSVRRRKGTSKENSESLAWILTCVFCNISLDLTRYLPGANFLEEIDISCQTHRLYGLALGRLGRFNESYRRMNEAESLNIFFSGMKGELNTMAINQYRVDVIIKEIKSIYREADHKKEIVLDFDRDDVMPLSEDDQRKICRLFDKANLLLSGVTSTLTGRYSTAYWRDRLHLLKLRLMCTFLNQEKSLNKFRPQSFGKPINLEPALYKEFNEGLLEVRSDDYYRVTLYYELFFFGIRKLAYGIPSGNNRFSFVKNIKRRPRFIRGSFHKCITTHIETNTLKDEQAVKTFHKSKELQLIYASAIAIAKQLDKILNECPD